MRSMTAMAQAQARWSRQYRQRRRQGLRCYELALDETSLTEALTLAGFLSADHEPDHAEVVAALERVIALWIEVEK
jgi:hypothetical protein